MRDPSGKGGAPKEGAAGSPGAGKSGRRRLRKRWRVLLCVLVIALACAGAGYGYWHYAYKWRRHHEPQASAAETSTEALYSEERFRSVLEKYGFGEGADLDQIVADSYVIPGLRATRTLKNGHEPSTCSAMVPQGVCEAGDHVLVSAYCSARKHNSVIYVLGKDSHELENVVVLRGTPHAGGIAYDPDHGNVWICGYDRDEKTAYLDVLPLDAIESYSLDDGHRPCEYAVSYPVYTMKRTSFIDYYDGQLYVGNFVNDQDGVSTVQTFPLKADDGMPYTLGNIRDFLRSGLTEQGKNELYGFLRFDSGAVGAAVGDAEQSKPKDAGLPVPAGVSFINGRIQGFTVDGDLTAVSQSGSSAASMLYLFKNDGTVFDQLRTVDNAVDSAKLPPMLEQVTISGDRLYLCFESAAYAYRARLNDKVDRIVVLRLDGEGDAQDGAEQGAG